MPCHMAIWPYVSVMSASCLWWKHDTMSVCQAAAVKCQIWLSLDIWHMTYDIWRHMTDIWHMTYDIWHYYLLALNPNAGKSCHVILLLLLLLWLFKAVLLTLQPDTGHKTLNATKDQKPAHTCQSYSSSTRNESTFLCFVSTINANESDFWLRGPIKTATNYQPSLSSCQNSFSHFFKNIVDSNSNTRHWCQSCSGQNLVDRRKRAETETPAEPAASHRPHQ